MPFFREKIYIYLILILFACVSCTTTSSLDLAIKYRNWQWIEHHVEKEGNIEKRNIHSLTPLMTAAYYGDHMVAEYLCRHNFRFCLLLTHGLEFYQPGTADVMR